MERVLEEMISENFRQQNKTLDNYYTARFHWRSGWGKRQYQAFHTKFSMGKILKNSVNF